MAWQPTEKKSKGISKIRNPSTATKQSKKNPYKQADPTGAMIMDNQIFLPHQKQYKLQEELIKHPEFE